MGSFLNKLFKVDERYLKKIEKRAEAVLELEEKYAALSDEELKAKTPYFKQYILDGVAAGKTWKEVTDEILPEAFATCREAAKRVLNQFPFKVQIMGAIVLNDGDVAEMRTGEGKTLTCTMSVYLNDLSGRGVHVVTVNEYLASRDAEWMGEIYRFLGLTVGCNSRALAPSEKKAAFNCDITYTTNSEVGFDYLRDNMVTTMEARVLRPLYMAVIDECDSILIDESRTPLIISGGNKQTANYYITADRFAKSLSSKHYEIDLKTKTCHLTDAGNDAAQRAFGIKNIYAMEYADLVHNIHQALKANYIMTRDVDYMVKENAIVIVDQFTGRMLPGRQYSDGLHQAIEAKENVKVNPETSTLATITYQNYFRLYEKIGGMTCTAKTEEEEFMDTYNIRVVAIPTNRPIQRIDAPDKVYQNKEYKFKALVQEVKERHEKGQPVLVGTVAVETSEYISGLFDRAGIPHEVLNAKNHEREALIVEQAGQMNAITIATNMAGRGTDIKLGPGVKDIVDPSGKIKSPAGLCVIGTERHESRRIDNQLRGRSGRQGDPGYSRFFVSSDDELMIRFAPDYLRTLFEKMGDEALESKMVMNAITSAQKKIEGQNFDTRKSLLDYDDVLRQQREAMYSQRDVILYADEIYDTIYGYFKTVAKSIVEKSIDTTDPRNPFLSGDLLKQNLEPKYLPEGTFDATGYDEAPVEEVTDEVTEIIFNQYNKKRATWPKEAVNDIEKMIALRCVDKYWTTHIDSMAKLKEGIHLRSYAQSDPLKAYVDEGWDMFNEMIQNIADQCVNTLLTAQIRLKTPEEIEADRKKMEELKRQQEANKAE